MRTPRISDSPQLLDRGPDPLVHLVEHRASPRPRSGAGKVAVDQRPRERFETLHGVAGAPPCHARIENARERRGPCPGPAFTEIAVQGIEGAEAEVVRERAGERGARAFVLAAGEAHERDQQVVEPIALGAPAEDVQAVADLHLLELAEVGVELGERLAGVLAGRDAAVPIEPEARDEVEDVVAQDAQAPGIHTRSLVVLVDEAFQIAQGAVALRPGEGRREVVDDHRLGAALGLRPFAGVVDDEGIHVRHRPERGLRVAGGGERKRLARQPLQVAVLAHVHHRVHPGPQPGVEGEVAVRRHERGVVVGRARVDVVAARGLDAHRRVAEAHRRHREAGRPVRRRHEERVPFGGAPAFAHRVAHFRREAGKEGEVLVEGEVLADLASHTFRVRGTRRQRPDERVAVRGDAVDGVSRRGHRAQQLQGSGGGVEADAVAEAPVAVGVVREHDADAPLARRRRGKRDPRAGERGAELDAVGAGRVGHDRTLGPRVEAGLGLEGHRAGENAPVHLGQRDVHRDVAGRKSLHALGPALLVPAREHDLEDGPPAGVERPSPPRRARCRHREAGGVQHQACVRLVQGSFHEVRGDGVLQARHVEGECVHPRGRGARLRARRWERGWPPEGAHGRRRWRRRGRPRSIPG